MFRKILDSYRRFMYGRYGADQLSYALIILYFVIGVVNLFVGSIILYLLQSTVFIFSVLRYLSKNIYKRREENRKFLALWRKFKNFVTYQRDKLRDRRVCRYRKCKHCRAALRLPIKKGKHSVNCPRCKKSFKVRIWI